MKPLQLEINDGKYTVVIHDDGQLEAKRYDEYWQDLTGNHLVFCLATELYEAREKINRLEGEIEVYVCAEAGEDY